MRAAIYGGQGKVEIMNVRRPAAPAGYQRVKVRAASICGTDLHFYSGEWSAKTGIILGHDACGVNEESGDRVSLEFQRWCGRCHYCTMGKENLCLNNSYAGFDSNGFIAEEAAVGSNRIFSLPENISWEEGACLEPVALALHSVRVFHPPKGRWVAVIGQGPVGLCLTQALNLAGCRVIGIDLYSYKLSLSESYGAEVTVDASKENVSEAVAEAAGEGGAGFVMEAAGTERAVDMAQSLVSRDGHLALVSGSGSPEIARPEVTTLGIVAYTAADKRKAIRLVSQGAIDVGRMISHTFPLSEIREALRTATDPSKKPVKIVLRS